MVSPMVRYGTLGTLIKITCFRETFNQITTLVRAEVLLNVSISQRPLPLRPYIHNIAGEFVRT